MRNWQALRSFFVFMAVVVAWRGTPAAERKLRPARLDDFFAIERVVSVALSPDGSAVAFIRKRSLASSPPPLSSSMVRDVVLQDLWIQDARGGTAKNVTRGESDGTGAWLPAWSPDGRRLAFLSNRGGDVTPWIWERATGSVRQASTRRIVDWDVQEPGFAWLDSNRLLCAAPPDGDLAGTANGKAATAALATDAWAKASRGEVTASVIESNRFEIDERQLFIVDLNSKKTIDVALAAAGIPPEGKHGTMWPAPDGRTLAYVRPGTMTHGAGTIAKLGYPYSVDIMALDGRSIPWSQPLPTNVLISTISWSPSGREIAFFANGDAQINPLVLYGPLAAEVMPSDVRRLTVDSLRNPARLWRVNVDTGAVESQETGELDLGELGAPSFTWTSTGELVFHASRRQFGITAGMRVARGALYSGYAQASTPIGPQIPREWLLLRRDGTVRPLTTSLFSLPDNLDVVQGGSAALVVQGGEVWRIDVATGDSENLTRDFEPFVSRQRFNTSAELLRHIVLTTRKAPAAVGGDDDQSITEYLFDLQSRQVTALERPHPQATLLAFDGLARTFVYRSSYRDGTWLWRGGSSGPFEILAEMNRHFADLEKTEIRSFDFTSLNGEALKGIVALPSGYVSGRRYPMLVEVRTGIGSSRLLARDFSQAPPPNPVAFVAAAGYLYMQPAMPRNLPGLQEEEGDSILMLLNAVMPAIDKVISTGLADPDRVFLCGWSRGAWSAAGLLTQTTRFKAALLGSGFYINSQVTGSGGSLWRTVAFRYGKDPHEYAGPTTRYHDVWPSEVPFWRDGDRIRRNSPFSYIERVQTPVLIMHGDLDVLPIEEAEDFFNGLVAQRKRAKFVRYWGEGHGNVSPANIRDRYQREFSWYDEFGDIARGKNGDLIFEGDRVKSRNGAPPWTPADFARVGPFARSGKLSTSY